MFLLRVIFWLTTVALLMPNDEAANLGAFDRDLRFSVSADETLPSCGDYRTACAAGLSALDTIESAVLTGLARVKTEIARQKQLREH